jgi:imidazole glycerol-phosphate synthase subunit HisH
VSAADAPLRVAVLDYKMSNLRSAVKALERLGAAVTVAEHPDQAEGAEAVLLPGVGAFGEAMRRIRAQGLDRVALAAAERGTPLLGICLGMQLLFSESEESPGVGGLGLLPGVVRRLDTDRKVPQIGWNTVRWTPGSPLGVEGAPIDRTYYFVHSYSVRPEDAGQVLGVGDYGGAFVAAVGSGPVAGVQFHPEKSSRAGLALLGRWIRAARPAVEVVR